VADLPYYLTSLEILPPLYYSEGNADDISKAPIGSGPYQFVEWSPENRLELKAVPDYWGGAPLIDTLIFQPVTDAAERVAQLTAGQADLITDLTLEQATTWDSAGGRLEAIESTRRIFIGLRVEEGTPLADKRVRQALNYAVDVQAIVNSLLGGYGQRYGNWVNASNPASNSAPWPFDVKKAQELLAEAGYAQGFDLVLDTPTGHYHQDQAVAQAIAEQLGQVGINVEVRAHDWSSYVENYLLPRQMGPLFLLGLNSRGNEWEDTNNLSFAFPFNLSSWQNAEFERLLKEARTTFNERQRQTLLSQAQAIAYEEVPWIWLWREYNFYGVKSDLNWQPRADGLVYLYQSAGSTEP
jgi:peptide/nickel transport system substrate-binding protein